MNYKKWTIWSGVWIIIVLLIGVFDIIVGSYFWAVIQFGIATWVYFAVFRNAYTSYMINEKLSELENFINHFKNK